LSRTIHTKTKFVSKLDIDKDSLELSISFLPTIQVTTTDLVKPSGVEFLSDIGGSMGFWLGLGVLQAADIIVNVIIARLPRLLCAATVNK